MSIKNYFDNNFRDYSEERLKYYELSEEFKNILEKFKMSKLNILTTKMQKEMLCNGTVYTGSAGMAYLYLRRHIKYKPPHDDDLKLAIKYLDLKHLKRQRISFLCGDAGPLALATVISYKMGEKRPQDFPDYTSLLQRLLDLITLTEISPNELLYGAAGYLYGLLFVKCNIPGNIIPSTHIVKFVKHILSSGQLFSSQMKSDSPLLWEWHDKTYLGAAHGIAGILYLLLQARDYVNEQDMQCLIKPTLDWLASKQFPSGNFPSSLGSSAGDKLVQWCHGAPGFVHLFVLAHQILGDEKYLQISLKCGDVIWQRGLCSKGYSICHGVSGNAYSFLCLYQATKEPLYLYRAYCFLEWCISERPGTEQHSPDRPASLFEGLLGRLFLAEDISQPDSAKFPAFTL